MRPWTVWTVRAVVTCLPDVDRQGWLLPRMPAYRIGARVVEHNPHTEACSVFPLPLPLSIQVPCFGSNSTSSFPASLSDGNSVIKPQGTFDSLRLRQRTSRRWSLVPAGQSLSAFARLCCELARCFVRRGWSNIQETNAASHPAATCPALAQAIGRLPRTSACFPFPRPWTVPHRHRHRYATPAGRLGKDE
jgi:hypothetical protein